MSWSGTIHPPMPSKGPGAHPDGMQGHKQSLPTTYYDYSSPLRATNATLSRVFAGEACMILELGSQKIAGTKKLESRLTLHTPPCAVCLQMASRRQAGRNQYLTEG